MCHVVCVEVKGQLVGIASLFLLHGFPGIELRPLGLEASTVLLSHLRRSNP